MHRLPAGNLIASASSLGGSCKFLQVGLRSMRSGGAHSLILPLDHMQSIIQAAGLLRSAAEEMGMVACAAAARDLGTSFERLPHPTLQGLSLNEDRVGDLVNNMEYLLRTFRDEIDARPLFVLPAASADLYDQAQPLFGDAVDQAFPSSAEDIREAGRCMAVGRWTAAVMHLMRALETPLGLLAAYCGVAEEASNWNKQLNLIEASLRQRSARDHGAAEEQWAAEAASQFRAIKNAWRNRVMHGRDTYDQERATEILDSVRALMRHLATRLTEPD